MPPPREEQVAQIEASLRRRFLPLVPKMLVPGREGWLEEQHDTDRLSRALAAYSLVGLCDLDDTTAAGTITDGSNDGGIDALHFDRSNNRLVFVQAKFKRTGTAPSQDENLKTINGIRALQARRFNEFNAAFQNRLDEIETGLDTAGVQILLVLAYLGDNPNVHVTADNNALKAELNVISPRMDWQMAGLSTIYGWLVAEQTPQAVSASVVLHNWAVITAPRKAVYGQITAATLAQLVVDNGKALFERNIRHYLGSVGVNTAIEETVRRRPGDFFYLNNGITAVVQTLTQAGGTHAQCTFGLENVSIVNGAQTAGAIANAAAAGHVSPDARVLITIIEIGAGGDDIGLRITRARNHQNVVRGVDFAALDPNQERLRQEMAVAGITYHYRPSAEARARRDDAFTLEEAAVALACLSLPVVTNDQLRAMRQQGQRPQSAIEYVVAAKKEIGRLWEQDGVIYGQLFPATLTGLRICRIVRIYRFIDQILAATERSNTGYHRRMFFRHARYFIMAFVGHRSADVMGRPEFALSAPDQTLMSQRTNEISEVIYAQTVPLQTVKGYLAIFRNMTDSQPLAEGVLQRLAQQEQQRQATPPPANPNPAPPVAAHAASAGQPPGHVA
ncbi:MAG: AIPR family protein [Limisphaerales bacterium]